MPDFTILDRITTETLRKAFGDLDKAIMDDTSEIGRRRQEMFGDRWSQPYTPPKSWATPATYSPHSYGHDDAASVMDRHGLPGTDHHDGTDPDLGVASASRNQHNDAGSGAGAPLKDYAAAHRFSGALGKAGIEEDGQEGNIHHFYVPHPQPDGTAYTASSLSGRVWRADGDDLTHVGTVQPGKEHEVLNKLKAPGSVP